MIPLPLQAKIDEHTFVLGSDECGLGSWAGPLSVCAAIAPKGWAYPGVTDSKKLTRAKREALYPVLVSSLTYHVVHMMPDEFDALGAGPAWTEAHTRAIQGALDKHLEKGLDHPLCVVDGNRRLPFAASLPKADLLITAVSAASIIAKTEHDRIMDELDSRHPGYSFSKCSGYGTKEHHSALRVLGVSPAHRKTYQPMKDMLNG